MLSRMIQSILLSGMTALLIACGGGGSSGKTAAPAATYSLSGVAAIGAALASASVTLKDSTGKTEITTTDDSGNFSFSNISSFTPPLMLQAKGTAAGQSYILHSVMTSTPAQGTNTLNVTPATEAITTQTLGADPGDTFDDAVKIKKIDPAKLVETKTKLAAALKDAITNLNIDNMDFMMGKFTADKTGMDKLFDLVEFSSDSSTGEIKLTNKNTRSSSTFYSNTKSNDVKKIIVSKEEASLDLSGINLFIQNLVKAMNNNDLNAFFQIYDKNYLHQGTNLALLKSKVTSINFDTKLDGVDFFIKKCDPLTKICIGTPYLTRSKIDDSFSSPVIIKLGQDGKWGIYGDQAPFNIDFYPMYTRYELINSQSKQINTATDNVGVYLEFSGESCGGCNDNKYKSAIFEFSLDGGTNYSSFLKLNTRARSNLSTLTYLGLDEGNGNITEGTWINGLGGYFFKFENKKFIADYNNALQSGLLKIRIKAFTAIDYGGQSVSWEPQVLISLFDPPSAESLQTAANPINTQKLTIDQKTLGTDKLTFDGKNINISYFNASNTSTHWDYGSNYLSADTLAFKGVVTPAKIKANCDKKIDSLTSEQEKAREKNTCTELGKDGFLINQASLISQNAQGGRVHLTKLLQ
jgi:hypothetical protein